MPYRYTTFNGIRLPDRMTEDDLGAPPANGTIVDSLGGGFNYLGNNRYYPKRHPINYRGMYVAAQNTYLVDEAGNYIVDEAGNYIITANAATILRSQIDDIKAQHGKWAALVRRREDDSVEQYKYARLLNVQHVRTLSDTNRIARVDLQFEAEGKPWRSTFGSNVFASLSANMWSTVAVTPSGAEDIRDAVFTLTATGSLTAFAIAMTGDPTYYLFFTGGLTSGQTVEIDTGAYTVKKNGVDSYADFRLGEGIHTAPDWMLLRGGGITNNLIVYPNGGTANLSITYVDQWA